MTLALVLFLVGITIIFGTVISLVLKLWPHIAEFIDFGAGTNVLTLGGVIKNSLGALAYLAVGGLLSLSGVAVFIYHIGKHFTS